MAITIPALRTVVMTTLTSVKQNSGVLFQEFLF